MIRIASAQLWVHDQDEALAFYVDKLGMEVRSDVTVAEMGDFRWLAVSPPGQPDVNIVLMAVSSPPMPDQATADQVRDLMGKGYAGTIFLTTEDIEADYRTLTERGRRLRRSRRKSGSTASTRSFRDPSGNHIRLTQLAPMPA